MVVDTRCSALIGEKAYELAVLKYEDILGRSNLTHAECPANQPHAPAPHAPVFVL